MSTYVDVAAALREIRLNAGGADTSAHLAVREAASSELAPEKLTAWRPWIHGKAREIFTSLPEGTPIDLVQQFAGPWSLSISTLITGTSPADTERLAPMARSVFLAAARATDSSLSPEALAATAELARSSPLAGVSARVQAFVAVTQTLPCFLAAAWLALFNHPAELEQLRGKPQLLQAVVDELLRFASPARAVFRTATAPVSIGAAQIAQGDRVILLLDAANHDPAQFPDPDNLCFDRSFPHHLAFGAGPHSCMGAAFIRMATAAATEALLQASSAIERAGEPEWIGGFAIRGPGSLPVILRRAVGAEELQLPSVVEQRVGKPAAH